jgi:dipeptidase E
MHAMKFCSFLILFLLSVTSGAAAEQQSSTQASVLVSGGSMMNGDHFADSVLSVMRQHYAGCRKVALVLHGSHPADRDRMEGRLQNAFAHIGVPSAESLHRHDERGARELLAKADAIFVGGGETFLLLRELTRTGQLEVIRELVIAGVPYGGASAGANVAGLIIGTTNDFPVTDIPSRNALALLPVTINPHHPLPAAKADYDARMGKIKIYLRFNPNETVLALGNASIVRLHAGRAMLVTGHAWIYRSNEMRELRSGELVPELMSLIGR